MKKGIAGSIILIFIVFFGFVWNLPLTKTQIEGVYINTHYENEFVADIPHYIDTLILKSDNSFESRYFGNGRYDVKFGFMATKITFTYDYEFGKAGRAAYFTNKLLERPRIILNRDLRHYYKKVK